MTTELSSKLDRITAYLRAVVGFGKIATPEKWTVAGGNDDDDYPVVSSGGKSHVMFHVYSLDAGADVAYVFNRTDANFIALSREFTPATAQAMLTAIEALDSIQILNTGYTENRALEALQSIASNFPDHLFQ
jgi:hypothetical protein